MEMRKIKGLQIAKTEKIREKRNGWVVPSQTTGGKTYFVNEEFVCDCPDSEFHNATCKHAYAVRFYLNMEIKTPKGIVIEKKPISYSQVWSIYDKGQIEEKDKFMELLSDLLKEVPETPNAVGRPKLSNNDMIFASALKVYTQFSLRRFMSDLRTAKEKKFVEHTPCFASVGHFMQNEELTPILSRLIQLTAPTAKERGNRFCGGGDCRDLGRRSSTSIAGASTIPTNAINS